jgi:hypothetical protein
VICEILVKANFKRIENESSDTYKEHYFVFFSVNEEYLVIINVNQLLTAALSASVCKRIAVKTRNYVS